MSLPSPSNPTSQAKPRPDLYTVLLLLTFFALVTGCLLLYFEMSDYGWKDALHGGSKPPPESVNDTPGRPIQPEGGPQAAIDFHTFGVDPGGSLRC